MTTCVRCGAEWAQALRFCGECGAPLNAPAQRRHERRPVSVVFVDLVGFTARSERSDIEEVDRFLQPYFEAVRSELAKVGGVVEKFIGDAVVAVFGAPIAHEDDPERAVRAALGVRSHIAALNAADDALDLHVRMAVTTGEALVDLDASTSTGEAFVTGDTVNTCARLQAAAPTDALLVDAATHEATARAIDYELFPAVTAKGKQAPVECWLAGAPISRVGDEGRLGDRVGLVGREAELQELIELFDSTVREHRVQLLALTGEPGIGKSRLVREFGRYIDDLPELVFWRAGRHTSWGAAAPFQALAQIVRAHAGIADTDARMQAADLLDVMLKGLDCVGAEHAYLSNALNRLLGLHDDAESSGDDRPMLFRAWRRFLELLAATSPLVVVFEDVHWADEGSLDFIASLVEYSADNPMLVIATARPELHDRTLGWAPGSRRVTTKRLEPLTVEASTLLLGELVADTDALTAALRESGGNPLFIEELARYYADQPANQPDRMPSSVHALIGARLDLLDAVAQRLLADAAVVGERFSTADLVALGHEETQLAERLARLENHGFVDRVGADGAVSREYRFHHALTRDVAYSRITHAERGRRHLSLGRALAAAQSSLPETVAHHFEQALHYGTAVPEAELPVVADSFAAHGAAARDSCDWQLAATRYEQAAELTPAGGGLQATRICEWVDAAHGLPREEAVNRINRALVVADQLGDPTAAACATVALLNQQRGSLDARDQFERVRDVLAAVETAEPSVERSRLYVRACYMLQETDVQLAVATARGAMSDAELCGSATAVPYTRLCLAEILALAGDARAAAAEFARIDVAAIVDPRTAFIATTCEAAISTVLGDARRTEAVAERMVCVAEECGSTFLRSVARCQWLFIKIVRGAPVGDAVLEAFNEAHDAERHFLRVLHAWTALLRGDAASAAKAMKVIAEDAADTQRLPAAMVYARAVAASDASEAVRSIGLLCASKVPTDDIELCLPLALQVLAITGHRAEIAVSEGLEVWCAVRDAMVERRYGDAAVQYEQIGHVPAAADAHVRHAAQLVDHGDVAGAEAAVARAEDLARPGALALITGEAAAVRARIAELGLSPRPGSELAGA